MGVVNVTPDSFSDGGVHLRPEAAIAAARRMLADGAAIVDVGGESTRPGSDAVGIDEELRRVLPVLEAVAGEVPVSIDTAKAEVARRALELGAELVNDVTALRADPALGGIVADSGAYLCLMHMQGEPRTMQVEPRYDDVVSEVASFLEQRIAFAVAEGVSEDRICVDPGIGFGKNLDHNLALLRAFSEFEALGVALLAGLSRKAMLGKITGREVGERVHASVAAVLIAVQNGARIVRAHDVGATRDALAVWQAVRTSR
jgi:dihydropteroate synthase